MLRLKTYTQITRFKNTNVTIDLDKVCYLYQQGTEPTGGASFTIRLISGDELVINESDVTMKKFIRQWRGEEE